MLAKTKRAAPRFSQPGTHACRTVYLVSLCSVCLLHFRQYFLCSNLSGCFRLFFVVV